MKRYFKIVHKDGPPGLCILSGPDGEIARALEAIKRIDQQVVEIEQKDARKVRAEIRRYEERRYREVRASEALRKVGEE